MSRYVKDHPGRPRLAKHPLAGSSYLAFPLESHAFTVDPLDDYRCLLCHRPRALHADPPDNYTTTPVEPPREGRHNRKSRATV